MEPRAYAEARGITLGRVSQLKKDGLLVTAPHPDGGRRYLVDATKSDVLRAAKGQAPTGNIADLGQARRAATIELANKQADLDFKLARNERQLGQLVNLAAVQETITGYARRVQDRVRSAVRDQAERLAVETDPRVIALALDEAVIAAITAAADEIESELDAEADEIEADTLAAMAAEEAAPDPDTHPGQGPAP